MQNHAQNGFHLHTVEVAGSIPASPILLNANVGSSSSVHPLTQSLGSASRQLFQTYFGGQIEKTVPPFTISEDALSVVKLSRHIEDWLIDISISQHSSRTIGERKDALRKFIWFMNEREFATCGVPELRRFFAYLNTGHTEPERR